MSLTSLCLYSSQYLFDNYNHYINNRILEKNHVKAILNVLITKLTIISHSKKKYKIVYLIMRKRHSDNNYLYIELMYIVE